MKNILSLSLLFCLSMVFGQNISDYQYIYVPAKFKDFEANQYNLNTQLKKALIDKISATIILQNFLEQKQR